MNPFKVKSDKSVKFRKSGCKRRPRTQHKRENVGGRRFRRYEDDDPDFKYYVKKTNKPNKPIPDNHVRQMGKNIILFKFFISFNFSFHSIQ